jgi:undecaprenyl-diphosphatase
MDWSIAHSVNTFFWHHDALEDPLLVYVQAAEALFLGMLLVVLAFARRQRWASVRRAGVAAGLSAGLALLTGKLITEFYDRPRPFAAHPGKVHLFIGHVADASFPSDHATASAAIATAILLRGKLAWGLVTMAFALILMFGRVALGFHYPSDVIGGALIGALAALILWAPALRGLIDALSDRAGAVWDQGVDKAVRFPRKLAHSTRERT